MTMNACILAVVTVSLLGCGQDADQSGANAAAAERRARRSEARAEAARSAADATHSQKSLPPSELSFIRDIPFGLPLDQASEWSPWRCEQG
jgi:hypothetical protein